MPTNVSRPVWRCDICLTRHGEDRAAAERCEAAGPPQILPPGSLMLDYGDGYETRGFRLRQLYPFPDRVGTLVGSGPLVNERAGHTVTYAIGINPADHWNAARGYYEWPNGAQPYEVPSKDLVPYAPRVLLVSAGRSYGYARSGGGDDVGWVLDAVGLQRGAVEVSRHNEIGTQWARPLTPEVREMLDAIDVWPNLINDSAPAKLYGRDNWLIQDKLGRYALAKTTPAGRLGNTHRAAWYLRGADKDTLIDEVNDLWRRWRAGEQVHVPTPWMVANNSRLTASKLSRHRRDLVAAAGVEWPARTDASAYARLLIEKTLEYRMDTTDQLFSGVRVVAVRGRKGGVGKSTVAAALATRLATTTKNRVVLIDCDLTGPSQHLIHNLGPVDTDPDRVMMLPASTAVPGLRAFSPGQVFPPGGNDVWTEAGAEQWLDFVGTSLDLGDATTVVLDMPPGEHSVHAVLTGRRGVRLAEVHVTTGHPLALADTERDLARPAENVGIRYLVENLSRITGHTTAGDPVELRLHGLTDDAPEVARRSFRTEWVGSLPWAPSIAQLADSPEIACLADRIAVAEPNHF